MFAGACDLSNRSNGPPVACTQQYPVCAAVEPRRRLGPDQTHLSSIMTRRRVTPVTRAIALAVFAAACSDHGPTQPRDVQPGSASRSVQPSPPSLDDRIGALADSVFAKGLDNAFSARWTNIKRQLARDAANSATATQGPAAAARQMFVELAQWTQDQSGAMTTPVGE